MEADPRWRQRNNRRWRHDFDARTHKMMTTMSPCDDHNSLVLCFLFKYSDVGNISHLLHQSCSFSVYEYHSTYDDALRFTSTAPDYFKWVYYPYSDHTCNMRRYAKGECYMFGPVNWFIYKLRITICKSRRANHEDDQSQHLLSEHHSSSSALLRITAFFISPQLGPVILTSAILKKGGHSRLHIYPLCGIFCLPWHRHSGTRNLFYVAFNGRSNRSKVTCPRSLVRWSMTGLEPTMFGWQVRNLNH
jgi:hypothetical protein